MRNLIVQKFNKLLSLDHYSGIRPEIELIRMRMTMRVCLISACFGLSFSIILLILKIYNEAFICLLQPISYVLLCIFVYKGYFNFAKKFHTFTSNWGIFVFASFCGADSGVHLYVLLGPIFVLSLYDLSQKTEIIFSLLTYVFTFFMFLFFDTNSVFPKITDKILTPYITFMLYSVNVIFVILLSTILMAYVLNMNTDFVYEILRKNKILSIKEEGLEKEIEQRKISENRLRRLFGELQVSFERINHFSQMVSHNMRSPIANLKAITTLINDPNISKEEKDIYIAAISDTVKKLDNVIIDMNEILTVQNDINEKRVYVSFKEELDSVLITDNLEIKETETTIDANFEQLQGIPTVRSFLHSIMQNLISNAIKYKDPNRNPVIKLVTYIENEHFYLKVSDNGIGIDLEKNKDKIFKPYKRFSKHVDGKGLGLYLVYSQAQMLGGGVKIESELGKGTTFMVDLGKSEGNFEQSQLFES